MRCMHARPHRRKDQLPLRSLRDLRSRYVFAPVRPRLARWEYKRPLGSDLKQVENDRQNCGRRNIEVNLSTKMRPNQCFQTPSVFK